MLASRIMLLVAIMMLSACATSPQGRTQVLAPASVSDVYSDVDMRLHIAVAPDTNAACLGMECVLNRDFDQQVQQIGARLAKAAFDSYPELTKRVSRFEFDVAEKDEFGSASNATGTIVIYRGVQKLYLDEDALAFLIAREMGHVIGHHHDENLVPSIAFSVATAVLFPAIGIFKGASLLASTTSTAAETTFMSTAAATAASSATSYIGSRAILASLRPDQLSEADVVALRLLTDIGCDKRKVASALESCTQAEGKDDWVEDFHISTKHVRVLAEQTESTNVDSVAQPIDAQLVQGTPQAADAPEASEIDAGEKVVEAESVVLHAEAVQHADEAIGQASMPDRPTADVAEIVANRQESANAGDDTIVAGNATSVAVDMATKNEVTQVETSNVSQVRADDIRPDAVAPKALPTRKDGYPIKAVAQKRKTVQTASGSGKQSANIGKTVLRKTGLRQVSATVIAKQQRLAKAGAGKGLKAPHGASAAHKVKDGVKASTVKSAGRAAGQGKLTHGKTRVPAGHVATRS